MTHGTCQFPIADDLNCGSPTPRRAAFCDFHEAIAAIQRKAGELLAKNPKATGTRGQLAGAASGAVRPQAPDAHFNARNPIVAAPEFAKPLTLAQMGITETQSAKWQKLAALSPEKIDETVAALTTATIECVGVTLADLNASTCRWPIGDPLSDDFNYCGAPSPVGKPYCGSHSRIAYEPRRARVGKNFAHYGFPNKHA